MAKDLKTWKTLSKKEVLKQGKHLRVELHQIELPDGEVIEDWPWVIVPDAVLVLAESADGDFLCFRQTKYAIEGSSLAPIGGMIEEGEQAIDAGKRELLEEAGYVSEEWTHLGSYALEPNRGVDTANLFLARRAKKVAEANSDDLEEQELLHLSKDELRAALAAGEFKVITWVATVALALDYLESES
jgi:ADP-ribose pyrophosphatase